MSEAPVDVQTLERELAQFRSRLATLRGSLEAAHLGRPAVIEELLLCLFAGGHALLEGAPGLGKTTLVKSLAALLDLSFARIQFTPDLMPGDILGARVLEEDAERRRHFNFHPGPVFAQVVLADEINRATPRTQSALLEAMQEESVTVFGTTRALEQPFFLIATENPIEMEGTYPLPEAQLDRFCFKILLASPELEALVAVLSRAKAESDAEPVLDAPAVLRLRQLARSVPASSAMVELAARVVLATHPVPDAPEGVRRYVRYGASPRGGLALLATARARALLAGRLHVTREDLEAVCTPALRHRLILNYEGEAAGVAVDELLSEAFAFAARRAAGVSK